VTDDSCRQLLVQCDFFCQFCMGTAVDSCDADTQCLHLHSIFSEDAMKLFARKSAMKIFPSGKGPIKAFL